MNPVRLIKATLWFVGVAAIVLAALIYVPRLVNVDARKPYIEQKLSSLTGLDVKIAGSMSLSVFPRISLVARDVKASDFIHADRVSIRLHSLGVLSGDMEVDDMVISGGELDLSSQKQKLKLEDFDELLSGRIFSMLMLRDSIVKLPDGAVVDDINATMEGLNGKGVRLIGAFDWRGMEFSGIKADVAWTDALNYSVSGQFGGSKGRDSLGVKGKLAVRAGSSNLFASVEAGSSNIATMLSGLGFKAELPGIGLFKGRVDLKTDIVMAADRISLSKGSLKNAETNGSFSAEIPRADGGGVYNVDFSSAKLSKLASIPAGAGASNTMALLNTSQPLEGFLRGNTLNLTVQNLILPKGVARNVQFASKPSVVGNGANTGFEIGRFSFQRGSENFDATGSILFFAGQRAVALAIRSMPEFEISHPIFGPLPVKGFTGRISVNGSRLQAREFEALIGPSRFAGNAAREQIDGRDVITLELSSRDVAAAKVFGVSDIDMPFIIRKIASLDPLRVNLKAEFARVDLGKGSILHDFSFTGMLEDGSLRINSMVFSEGARASSVSGELAGLVGDSSGEFRNFRYSIVSSDGKGMKIPFIPADSFVAKLITGDVSSVSISMDGDAADPETSVVAGGAGISVKVDGRLFGPSGKYSLSFSHPELKGFLFAFGFIDEGLMDYFYDSIPFEVIARVDGSTVSGIKGSIKGNAFTGSVGNAGAEFRAERLDSRLVLKRLADTGAYADFILRLIRALPIDFALSVGTLGAYDGNVYTDFALDLKPARNPGSMIFSFKKGARSTKIESEILNARIFNGTLELANYPLPEGFMGDDAIIGLQSGTMDARLGFSTNGLNASQLVSSLSGDFELEVRNGVIRGMSGYDALAAAITALPNITSNNVVKVIGNGMRTGELPFSSLRAKGSIRNAAINSAAFTLVAKNIEAFGLLSTDLIRKSLDIAAELAISRLSSDALKVPYRAHGFINNLDVAVSADELAPRINTLYLQKLRR